MIEILDSILGAIFGNVKILVRDENCVPTKAHERDAGYDLKSMDSHIIQPNSQKLIDTGINIKLPKSFFYIWEAQIRPRSGLALKKGITITNTPGTVDNDYIGNIGVIIRNNGTEDFVIQKYDRIAQMVITRIPRIGHLKIAKQISNTDRSSNGFGSSGK